MSYTITPITFWLPYHLSRVNCYLIKTDAGIILIDTGGTNNRVTLEQELFHVNCPPVKFALIVLTHGDFDHTGNAAYLRQKFGVKIAIHQRDARMLECGDMFVGRKPPNVVIRKIASLLFKFGASNCCSPDILLEDGDNLSEYGLDARVLYLPGHSSGSIGILTAAGDLFCGDLLENTRRPALTSLIDDAVAAQNSIAQLQRFTIQTVYPGHGKPFRFEQFRRSSET